jgi:D-threonate/D-erythronate kinase
MLAILADDLTGALDTAAPFAARGMHVEVALSTGAIGEALRETPQVLSINLASREIDADAAMRQAKRALAVLPAGARLFKKVDSRLKGHVAAELDAIDYQTALVAPAIPAFGRIVKDGCVAGFGVDMPISIAEKLGSHAARATIPDIASQNEMRLWLERADETGIDLLVGARGLAEALAEAMSGHAPAPLKSPQVRAFSSSVRVTRLPLRRLRHCLPVAICAICRRPMAALMACGSMAAR